MRLFPHPRLFLASIVLAALITPPAFAQSTTGTPATPPAAPKSGEASAKSKSLGAPPSAGASRMEILGRKSDRLGRQMENSVCKC